jgi:hypothetical protein
MRGAVRLTLVGAAIASCAGAAGQTPSDVDALLARVGDRLAAYYRRAQNVMCIERYTVQPISWDFNPQGFARITESELRVEPGMADGDGGGEPTVIRQLRKVNGRPPRERDKKDRAGCTDPNPLSTEPLAFLLPAHRAEYRFSGGGAGRGKDRNTLLIDYALAEPSRRIELIEDREGHADCFDWSGEVPVRGRIWVDAATYDVVRVERRIAGPVDVRVPTALQRRHLLADPVVVERDELTIRYKTVAFTNPDEAMLLPESIDTLIVLRGGLQSTRRSQTFTAYQRFVTGAKLVK